MMYSCLFFFFFFLLETWHNACHIAWMSFQHEVITIWPWKESALRVEVWTRPATHQWLDWKITTWFVWHTQQQLPGRTHTSTHAHARAIHTMHSCYFNFTLGAGFPSGLCPEPCAVHPDDDTRLHLLILHSCHRPSPPRSTEGPSRAS